eukprot:gb/GECG01001920.1/.p1 GENE.gb/GECG01001920.1/~~gb/GECG01001920.1/.p1  ORF type:complete len:110 (+),score=13.67 gb/GECG01001920.1/:1-330(+)
MRCKDDFTQATQRVAKTLLNATLNRERDVGDFGFIGGIKPHIAAATLVDKDNGDISIPFGYAMFFLEDFYIKSSDFGQSEIAMFDAPSYTGWKQEEVIPPLTVRGRSDY